MRILIEEYRYPARDDVLSVVRSLGPTQGIEGKVSVGYVGYYYNADVADCVFILPKVLMDENELVFGDYKPEDIIHLDATDNPLNATEQGKQRRRFIYELAVWVYRAVTVYKERHPASNIIYHERIANVGHGRRRLSNTYLDILLSLTRFARDNQDFFFTIIKNRHGGHNKINWTRTVGHTTAHVERGAPLYLSPVNKRRQVNLDEELMVIFFSILDHLHRTYGFPADSECRYEPLSDAIFKSYLRGMGKARLREIKYKYFSDKALELWELCYAFFDETSRIAVNTNHKEYLLAKDFNIVFEDIIDELIGDNPLPDDMSKKQEDGKIVDHLFTARSLIENDSSNTYFIGDSKYYKMGHPVGNESVYKQFTYARNVIQWNIDIFGRGDTPPSGVKLRDDITEGYNIIPNFFISAKVEEPFDYGSDGIDKTDRSGNKHRQTHFANRLFDRDTLLLFHYDVNFLFVLALYARNNAPLKAGWKQRMRDRFRDEIRQWLEHDYDFYALRGIGNPLAGEEFINEHFKQLQGKLFRPYADRNIYTMAIERPATGTSSDDAAYRLLSEFFVIEPIHLGDDPKERLDARRAEYQAAHPYTPTPANWLPEYHVERYAEQYFVIGMYHDREHWDWITGKNDKGELIYNVRLGSRPGGETEAKIRQRHPRFVILYEEGSEALNNYHVFHIHNITFRKQEQMEQSQYPSNHGGPRGNYLVFRFDEEVSIGRFDINEVISRRRFNRDYVEGAPIYLTGAELLQYRLNTRDKTNSTDY